MPIEHETDNNPDEDEVSKTAESTRFRVPSDPAPQEKLWRGPESYVGSVQSIRLHHARHPRGGLAMRLIFPIILSMIVAFLAVMLLIRNQINTLQLDDLKVNAADSAFSIGMLGRFILVHRDKFIMDNPEYLSRAEWRTGSHWLVTHGFVAPSIWAAATGFQLDEYAPASIMDQAARNTILSELDLFLNNRELDSEIVHTAILNADGSTLASSTDVGFRFDAAEVKAVPFSGEEYRIGGTRVQVQYIDSKPEPVVRAVASLSASDDPNRLIGYAIVVLRTERHDLQKRALFVILLATGGLLALLMTGVIWYSARRVIIPMRRLVADMQAIAEGDYSRRAPVRSNDEVGMLAQAFNAMAERLRLARLNEKETSRLESDLSIARDIQNNLLPPQTPRVRGLDIHTSYRPAKEIGGDYFDFLPVDGEHMGLVVADASGKSIPAALVMSTTRAILRFVAPGGRSAAETLTRVNAILSVDIPRGMFVTAYYVILDPLDNTMLCASAGHTPLLIARADGSVELVNPGGIALGFDGGPIFQRSIREQRVRLETGDRVLLYTDGVVECVNTANEEYSDRRLREFLRRNRDLSSHDFVGALMADLDRHRGTADMRDDTTIVSFKVL